MIAVNALYLVYRLYSGLRNRTAPPATPPFIQPDQAQAVRTPPPPVAPQETDNKCDLIIINDLFRYDHRQWQLGQPHGGACTSILACIILRGQTPIYTNKHLLAYVGATDFYCHTRIEESLKKEWDIFDINPEYCLLRPKSMPRVMNIAHGTPVTIADICKQLLGAECVTRQMLIDQASPDGTAFDRRAYLHDFIGLLSKEAQWHIAITGHGGDVEDGTRPRHLTEHLAGMPRQTLIHLFEELARIPTRIVYVLTCHGASAIRDHAFGGDSGRTFSFPIMFGSCSDGAVIIMHEPDVLLERLHDIKHLDSDHENDIFTKCIATDHLMTPSIRWAGTKTFVPLQGFTQACSVVASSSLTPERALPHTRVLTVLLEHENNEIVFPERTTRVEFLHTEDTQPIYRIKRLIIANHWTFDDLIMNLNAHGQTWPHFYLIIDQLKVAHKQYEKVLIRISTADDELQQIYWQEGENYWFRTRKKGSFNTAQQITSEQYQKGTKIW